MEGTSGVENKTQFWSLHYKRKSSIFYHTHSVERITLYERADLFADHFKIITRI